jgi:hypothetical protein
MRDEISAEKAVPLLKEGAVSVKAALENMPTSSDEVTAESLALLQFMLQNVQNLIEVLLLKATGADEKALAEANARRKRFFNENEMRFQPYADGFYVNMIVDGIVDAKEVGIYG